MKKVGFVGWRGMVGSVLMERMTAENDFADIEPVFFSTSQVGQAGPDVGKDIPAQIEEARERFPDLDIELMRYFGSAAGLAPLVVQHLQEQEN